MAYAGDRIMDMETAAAVTEAMELTGMIIMTTGHHGHGRSYDEVKSIIAGSHFPEAAKAAAAAVYANIARAEAKVHGATLETVHFHEVGRDEAIINALATGMAVSYIETDEIRTSAIYDGKGYCCVQSRRNQRAGAGSDGSEGKLQL